MNEWIDIDKAYGLPPKKFHFEAVLVKRRHGEVLKAFYHPDMHSWLAPYNPALMTYFTDRKTGESIFDVTHWMPINEES